MSEIKSSSKELLKGVFEPHIELALELMKMVNPHDTNDSSYRFQIASIIIFLAGIDKTLSLAFELMYLAGKVNWNWMVPNTKFKPPVGFIECQRGLSAKIMKLKELGADVTRLQGIIDLRNEYVHSCHIYVGYTVGIDEVECKTLLNPSVPEISFLLPPITALRSTDIQYYAEQLTDVIGSFIDRMEWQNEWLKLSQKIEHLPHNPEPEYTLIVNNPEKELEILDSLNQKFVGDGAKLLRDRLEKPNTRCS